jgi:hypothetical protein
MSIEQRRGARFPAHLWIRVADVTPVAELCWGNISISGIFFETERDFGNPGDVHLLSLANPDRSLSIDIMGKVIRVLAFDDLWKGTVIAGVALEFLVESDSQRDEVAQFVRALSTGHPMDYRFSAQVEGQGAAEHQATIRKLDLDGMLMETDWPITTGETINVLIAAPASGETIHLSGRTIKARPATLENGSSVYQVEVRFAMSPQAEAASAIQQPAGTSISEAVEILLTEAIAGPKPMIPRPAASLRGSMAQVQLENLLAFVEMEGSTGVLHMVRGQECVDLFFQQGHLVDVTAAPSEERAPKNILDELVEWTDGEFEFLIQPVHRKDVIDATTSTLLNDLARQRAREDHQK